MASAPALRSMDLAHLLSTSLAPVQAQTFAYLGPKEFLALSEVSKGVYVGLKEALRATVYNIDIKLKKFFADPKAFRKVQAESGALIGHGAADFVYAFFTNDAIPDELHVYVKRDCDAALYAYLLGAGFHNDDSEEERDKRLADDVFKKITGLTRPLEVLIHTTFSSPLYVLLHGPPSTSMTSFIAWNRAYCMFPRDILLNQIGYLVVDLEHDWRGTEWAAQLKSLSQKGIKTMGLHWDEGGDDIILTRMRRIGDEHTLVITLDGYDLGFGHTAPDSSSVIESSTFRLAPYEPREYDLDPFVDRYELSCEESFTHSILRHSYITVEDDSQLAKKIAALSKKLDDLTLMELAKLSNDERPPDYDGFMGGDRDERMPPRHFSWMENDISVPGWWTYYDDDLVAQFQKLWKKYGKDGDVRAAKA